MAMTNMETSSIIFTNQIPKGIDRQNFISNGQNIKNHIVSFDLII